MKVLHLLQEYTGITIEGALATKQNLVCCKLDEASIASYHDNCKVSILIDPSVDHPGAGACIVDNAISDSQLELLISLWQTLPVSECNEEATATTREEIAVTSRIMALIVTPTSLLTVQFVITFVMLREWYRRCYQNLLRQHVQHWRDHHHHHHRRPRKIIRLMTRPYYHQPVTMVNHCLFFSTYDSLITNKQVVYYHPTLIYVVLMRSLGYVVHTHSYYT